MKDTEAGEPAHLKSVDELVRARTNVHHLIQIAEQQPGTPAPGLRLEIQAALLRVFRLLDSIVSDSGKEPPESWTGELLGRLKLHPEALSQVPHRYESQESEDTDETAYAPFVVDVDRWQGGWLPVNIIGLRALPCFTGWTYTYDVERDSLRGEHTEEVDDQVIMPFAVAVRSSQLLDREIQHLGFGVETPVKDAQLVPE